VLCFLGIICSFGFGQTVSPDAGVGHTNVLDELNKLRQTMADQQKSIVAQQKSIADQQKSIADQQGQIAAQQYEIERLRQQLGAQPQNSSAQTPPQFVNATLNTSASSMLRSASDTPAQERPKESPLSFRIGGADFTPGGFVDFENIFRTTNTGNAATTSFGVIPFSNTVAGAILARQPQRR
jgi:TolA-binding protein